MDIIEQRKMAEHDHLENARAQLTKEQRDRLDQISELRLREEQAYDTKYEIALAQILYEARPYVHERADIEGVVTRAYNEAREREAKEQRIANLLASKEEQVRGEEPAPYNVTSESLKTERPSNPILTAGDMHLQELLAVAREELSHKDKEGLHLQGDAPEVFRVRTARSRS